MINIAGLTTMITSTKTITILAISMALQGCVGLGGWIAGTESKSFDAPKVYYNRGSIAFYENNKQGDVSTSAELIKHWGEPDEVTSLDDGREEWIYKRDTEEVTK